MSYEEDALAPLVRSKTGHDQRVFAAILAHYGFREVDPARHGRKFVSDELKEHPDLKVRQSFAFVLIPNGCENVAYPAQQTIKAVRALLELRRSRSVAKAAEVKNEGH